MVKLFHVKLHTRMNKFLLRYTETESELIEEVNDYTEIHHIGVGSISALPPGSFGAEKIHSLAWPSKKSAIFY